MPRKLRTFLFLLRRSLVAAFDDGCLGFAKGAAYSALLSFFPLLTSAATILIQARANFVSGAIEDALTDIVPPGTEELVFQQFRLAGERPGALLVVAGFISLWAASGVVKSLIEGFHAAYRVPRNRGYVRQSIVAMTLVLVCALPMLAASLLIVFGGQIERSVMRGVYSGGLHPPGWLWEMAGRMARYSLALLTTAAVAALLYYLAPYRRQQWRFIWPGAILATFLWLLSTSGFAWYVRHMAHYNVMYGSIGAGIALLVWMYLLAAIALVGCEYNAAVERSAPEAGAGYHSE